MATKVSIDDRSSGCRLPARLVRPIEGHLTSQLSNDLWPVVRIEPQASECRSPRFEDVANRVRYTIETEHYRSRWRIAASGRLRT
jgi:hypothetical protein